MFISSDHGVTLVLVQNNLDVRNTYARTCKSHQRRINAQLIKMIGSLYFKIMIPYPNK